MITLAIALSCIIPHDNVIRDEFDLVELNHYYDCEIGKERFAQLIFWEWDWAKSRYRVADYRMVKVGFQGTTRGRDIASQRVGSDYRIRFTDNGLVREISATSYRETWTDHDQEADDRQNWPMNCRRKLRNEKKQVHNDTVRNQNSNLGQQ